MDGENNGIFPIKMDDLGGKPTIFRNTHIPPGGFRKIIDSKVPPWYGI